MWVALGAIFQDLRYWGARTVVITGANGEFCGAPISVVVVAATVAGPGATGTSSTACACSPTWCWPSTSCPVPVVAKVDGVCVGAGLGLALAVDVTWRSDRARFSAIFARRGLSLDFGTSWLLRQRLPVHKAKELALTAGMMMARAPSRWASSTRSCRSGSSTPRSPRWSVDRGRATGRAVVDEA